MTTDDEDDDRSDNSDWIPPPPPDDDEYEDPNPRAAGEDEPRKPYVRPVSAKQAQEEAAAKHLAESISLIGLKGTLAGILDVVAREPVTTPPKTCPQCNKESVMLFRTASNNWECGRCQGDRNRRKVDHMATLVRELKQAASGGGASPEREREILAQLREYDHPDIDGLMRWCREANDRATASAARTPSKKRGGW